MTAPRNKAIASSPAHAHLDPAAVEEHPDGDEHHEEDDDGGGGGADERRGRVVVFGGVVGAGVANRDGGGFSDLR